MVTVLITHLRGLITPLITTQEPPSRGLVLRACDIRLRGQSCQTLNPKP